jgi:hypothetical protein
MDDLVYPARRDGYVVREPVLRYSERFEKFLKQYFAGMDRRQSFLIHKTLLMVVNYLDLERVAFMPAKTYSPLLVDPNTMLDLSFAFQFFKPIRRRISKILDISGSMQDLKLSSCNGLNVLRKFARDLAIKQLFSFFIGKTSYHRLYNNASRYCLQRILAMRPISDILLASNMTSRCVAKLRPIKQRANLFAGD